MLLTKMNSTTVNDAFTIGNWDCNSLSLKIWLYLNWA